MWSLRGDQTHNLTAAGVKTEYKPVDQFLFFQFYLFTNILPLKSDFFFFFFYFLPFSAQTAIVAVGDLPAEVLNSTILLLIWTPATFGKENEKHRNSTDKFYITELTLGSNNTDVLTAVEHWNTGITVSPPDEEFDFFLFCFVFKSFNLLQYCKWHRK